MFDDGIITLGDGEISVNGEKVSGSRTCVRDPRLHHPTQQMIDDMIRRADSPRFVVQLKPDERQCAKCGEIKGLNEFPADKRYAEGHEWRCHDCEAERKRQEYAEQVGRPVRDYQRQQS